MSMALDGFPAGWASLPRNLLDCIFDGLLPNSGDIVRFSAVCTYWRAVAWENFQFRQLPFLVVPVSPMSYLDGRMSYNVSTMVGDMELSLPKYVGLYGCSCGWLILVKADEVFLLDPSSGETIRPPRVHKSYPNHYPITKRGAALSASPHTDPDGYVLMVTYGDRGDLAFIRAGDPNWTYLDDICYVDDDGGWHHLKSCLTLTYHNGLFFCLEVGGALVSIDVKSSDDFTAKEIPCWYTMPPRIELQYFFHIDVSFVKHYENGKEHLWTVVRRKACKPDWETCAFEIYELMCDDDGDDVNEEYYFWMPVTNLGDLSLFLGEASSYSFLAGGGGSQPNTIYFYDRKHLDGGRRILGFNLEDGSIIFRPLDHIKNLWSDQKPIVFLPTFI